MPCFTIDDVPNLRSTVTAAIIKDRPIVIIGGWGQGKSRLAHEILGPDGEYAKGYALIDEAWSHFGPGLLVPDPGAANLSRTITCWQTHPLTKGCGAMPFGLLTWAAENGPFFTNALKHDAVFIYASIKLGHRAMPLSENQHGY